MKLFRFLVSALLLCKLAFACAADPVPTLNDILNASQLDVRSSEALPKPADAQVVEVRSDAPLRQMFHVGANVTRLASIAIWFSGWSSDWTPEKSLVLRLYAGQDYSRILAQAEEPYSRRSWEGAVHVFTLNVPVAQNTDYTFELTTRGGRILTGAALARLPLDASVGPLTSNGETLPGALWFETVVKRRSDLDRLYLGVFSHFDLNRPDLRAVRDAVSARDWDRAKRAVVTHFESRKDLFPDEANHAPKSDTALKSTLADAGLVVQHKLRAVDEIVDLGPRWNHMSAWRSRGGVGLTRTGLRGVLAAAYTATHDEKYAKAWDEMLRFQFEDLPSPLRAGIIPPDAQDISPIGEPGIGGGSMWASLSIGARMMHGFAYYRAFKNSPSFSLDTRFAFLANLAEMSDVLEKMKGGGNWEAQNTTALLEFGRSFPEYRKAQSWQARGFAGALQSCLDNTYPDGPLREATTNYHSLSLNRYLGALESAKTQSPVPTVPPTVQQRVEKMCDYLLYSTKPNGQLPIWGDSNPPFDAAALLLRGADYFARPDMRWAATAGKAGTPPRETSKAFPDAGYYIMRSGWSPNAAFLALHNGRSTAHGHNDANSFVLSAFGNDLLIDPGVYIYGTPESQLLTRSLSHNTVTMDDRNTLNDRGTSHLTSGWLTDLYDGTNAGYEGQKLADSGARHRRIVLFLKPSLFFVVDQANSDQLHDWALRSHFAPGEVNAAPDGKSLLFRPSADTAYPGSGHGGLRLWSAPQEDVQLTIAPGLTSGGWERKIEAPVAVWSQFRTSVARWATLLEPFASAPSPYKWDVRQDDQGTAMAFQRSGNGRRYLLVRTDSEALLPDSWVQATGLTTDAAMATYEEQPAPNTANPPAVTPNSKRSANAPAQRAAKSADNSASEATLPRIDAETVLHQDTDDDLPRTRRPVRSAPRQPQSTGPLVRRLTLHSGSLFLQPRADIPSLLHAEEPVTLLEASWNGDTLTVHRVGGSGIVLRTFDARKLILNGRTTPIPPGTRAIRLPDTAAH